MSRETSSTAARVDARRILAAAVLATVAFAAGAVQAAPVAELDVDAREAPRGILKAHLRLPVTPGVLTLVYPKWLPGRHSPAGPITSLAGPVLHVGTASLAWRRDREDPYAFHLVVPDGAAMLDVDLEVLTAIAPDGLVQGLETPRTATESLAIVEWNQLVLYPAGVPSDGIDFRAAIRLPAGWQAATALTPDATWRGEGIGYQPVSLTALADATLLAGRYLRSYELGGSPPVALRIAADRAVAAELPEPMLLHYRALVAEATTLFGATHYRRYQFLWALTDQIMPDGLEHHESSDDRSPLRTLQDDDLRLAETNLLPHEYTHSWNGKFRRPTGLATPDYQVPMQGELLWVYEGLTEYLGDVLAARSGLWTQEEFRSELARIAGQMNLHSGRAWRNLQDATDAAPLLYYQDHNWSARLRRQDDFYQESALLWLEADVLIRKLSHGQRSLDDFCRHFYGAPSTAPEVRGYGVEEVVAALEATQPYDWRGFWRERLQRHRAGAPLEGLAAAGWRYALTETPNRMQLAHEAEDHDLERQQSLGFVVALDGGTLSDIVPGSPADVAGLAPGEHLVAIDGHKWSREVLHDALVYEAPASGSVTLLVEKDDEFRTVVLNYAGGEPYANLVRGEGEDLLAAIGRAHAAVPRSASR